jgi:Peptidase inhibitor I78 family
MRVAAFALAPWPARSGLPVWVALLWLLAGCALFAPRDMVGPVDEVMFAAQPDSCGLAAVAGLQGQDFTELADHRLIGQLRVIWPGQEVMSGLVPTRLNAQVSDQGRIGRLFCG